LSTKVDDGFSAANADRERIRLNVSATNAEVGRLGGQADKTKERVRGVERQVGINRLSSNIATRITKDALASPFKQAWKKARELFGKK
jgi:hypothetical protein